MERSSWLGSRQICDAHDGAFYLFAAGALHLALVAADLVLHVAAHNEIGRFQGVLFYRAAGVLLTRCREGKIVLLILVGFLVGCSRRLEILQRGCASIFDPAAAVIAIAIIRSATEFALRMIPPPSRLYVDESDRCHGLPGITKPSTNGFRLWTPARIAARKLCICSRGYRSGV